MLKTAKPMPNQQAISSNLHKIIIFDQVSTEVFQPAAGSVELANILRVGEFLKEIKKERSSDSQLDYRLGNVALRWQLLCTASTSNFPNRS